MILSDGQVKVTSTQLDTIADRNPLFSDASYYPHSAIALSDTWAAYGAIYRHQVWVNTIVRKLAFGTARLPFEVKTIGDAGHSPEDGPLAKLLARPNDRLDSLRLWLWTSATFDIYGEAFWLKLRDNSGRVRELHPMHPSNVILRRDENGVPFYIYSTGVRNVSQLPPIPFDDVVPFLSYNPEVLGRGLSNLEPLRQTLAAEDSSRRANDSVWRRGARPSLMITAPNGLSDKAYDRLKSSVDRVHGGVDNAGGTLVLEEGAVPKTVQLSSSEMQYIESRKLNREEVCAAYDMPPPVVHILDKATFSNITEQMRSMYRDTMPPRLGLFESAIAHHLIPDFYPSGAVVGQFNLDDVLRGDFETRAVAVANLIEKGVLMPAEGRAMFSLPEAGEAASDPAVGKAARKLYANAALQELGRPAERVTITATAPASPGEAAEAADAEQGAAAESDSRRGGTRTVVDYAPVRRGGRPPKSTSKETE